MVFGETQSKRTLLAAGRVALPPLLACAPASCLPSAQGRQRPNVIFIVTDDAGADDTRYMPNLRSETIERGTTFENPFVTNPLCCPSRATAPTRLRPT